MRNLRYGIESGKILIGKIKRNESSFFFSLIFAHSLNICCGTGRLLYLKYKLKFCFIIGIQFEKCISFRECTLKYAIEVLKEGRRKDGFVRNWE